MGCSAAEPAWATGERGRWPNFTLHRTGAVTGGHAQTHSSIRPPPAPVGPSAKAGPGWDLLLNFDFKVRLLNLLPFLKLLAGFLTCALLKDLSLPRLLRPIHSHSRVNVMF